jgi:hypothetical protein
MAFAMMGMGRLMQPDSLPVLQVRCIECPMRVVGHGVRRPHSPPKGAMHVLVALIDVVCFLAVLSGYSCASQPKHN